jgi:hypothetical protein
MSKQTNLLLNQLKAALETGQVQWQKHALTKMLERGISRNAVFNAIMHAEIIEYYPTDRPFPSCLIFSLVQGQALHVVAAYDKDTDTAFVITAYMPDQRHFMPDCRTRR